MGRLYPLRIDAYSHIVPKKYNDFLQSVAPGKYSNRMALYDLEYRFRIMDRFEGLIQVITLGIPPIEAVADQMRATDLAKRANDEMAELVSRYPERFAAAIAVLPMNNMDAALAEVDRAVKDLKMRGVMIYTPINDKPIDLPEFMPLYEKMSGYNLPILLHPTRDMDYPDYRTEDRSQYRVHCLFGWPYETTVAMTRLIFSGVLERFPNLKVVTHHCGGFVPFLEERIKQFYDTGEQAGRTDKAGLTRAPIDYYRMFYNDTAIDGNTSALMCARAFFGADRLLFGADMPLGCRENGARNYRQTINAIETMEISDAEKKAIYEDNARKLYRLPI